MAKKAQKTKAPAKKAKKPSKKAAASKAKKSSGADAPAHPNELALGPRYDRCSDEKHNLDPARTPFASKPKPPRALCGHEFKGVKLSKDGWAPGENKPRKCKLTYKELAENWAAEHTPAELKQFKKDCVWNWRPGMPPPDWWRLDIDDDATYRVLCLCWVLNFRCYQPVMGLDFDEFCKKALANKGVAARLLLAINKSCRSISEKAWNKKNKKPEKCDDSVYVGFFT